MNKCNIDSDDTQAIDVIKLGINEAYGEIAKDEKISVTVPLPIIDGVVNLPDDTIDVLNTYPELSDDDKKIGRKIFTELTGDLSLTYSYLPVDMEANDDEPEISERYHKLLITYGCYSYYQFKKKNDVAGAYMNAYLRGKQNLRSPNRIRKRVVGSDG